MMLCEILVSIAVSLSLVHKSLAIYCLDCNSANNSACLNPSDYDEEIRARLIPIIDCEMSITTDKPRNFFCRKIVQTIYHRYRNPELRVTRSCGWVVDEKPCYKARSEDYVETVCQCFTNHCNSADDVDSNTCVALFILLSAVLYFYR